MAGRREAGFTLLEVLVAFIIAAFALAALFRAAVASQAGTATAARYEEALSRARSRLAVLDATSLAAGDQQGDDGSGFQWRIRTQPLGAAQVQAPAAQPSVGQAAGARAASTAPQPPVLYAVSVAVSWSEAGHVRSVQLDTRRLGAALPRPP